MIKINTYPPLFNRLRHMDVPETVFSAESMFSNGKS